MQASRDEIHLRGEAWPAEVDRKGFVIPFDALGV